MKHSVPFESAAPAIACETTAAGTNNPPGQDRTHGRSGHCVKRDAILGTAARIFHRDGFQGASIDLIASEAGVSRQTIYNHYRDKETLLGAVVNDSLQRVNDSMFDLLAAFPDDCPDLQQALEDFAWRLGENCIYNASGAFLRKLAQSSEPLQPEILQLYAQKGPAVFLPALAERLDRLAGRGRLDISDPQLAARHFMALINADVHYCRFAGKEIDTAIIQDSARNGVAAFLRAYGTNRDNQSGDSKR